MVQMVKIQFLVPSHQLVAVVAVLMQILQTLVVVVAVVAAAAVTALRVTHHQLLRVKVLQVATVKQPPKMLAVVVVVQVPWVSMV
jgi:hypothetical protein